MSRPPMLDGRPYPRLTLTSAEDSQLFDARTLLLELAARAGNLDSVDARLAVRLAREAFARLATLCSDEISDHDYQVHRGFHPPGFDPAGCPSCRIQPIGIGGAMVADVEVGPDGRMLGKHPGVFCGECGDLDARGPFTIIRKDTDAEPYAHEPATWLCRSCAENWNLIIGHNYASGECPCGGDARAHGYLNANGD